MATGKYFFFFSFFIFSPCCATCRILVSRLGIKSVPPALEAQSLNHWTTREVSGNVSLKKKKLFMTVLYLYCCSWAFSSCREWGLLSSFSMQASHCGGFSCCKARDLRLEGSVVGAHELSCPMAYGFLVARPRIKPVFSALASGFLTTRPSEKYPQEIFLNATDGARDFLYFLWLRRENTELKLND